MAKLISVPDRLYDELRIMKKEASKRLGIEFHSVEQWNLSITLCSVAMIS